MRGSVFSAHGDGVCTPHSRAPMSTTECAITISFHLQKKVVSHSLVFKYEQYSAVDMLFEQTMNGLPGLHSWWVGGNGRRGRQCTAPTGQENVANLKYHVLYLHYSITVFVYVRYSIRKTRTLTFQNNSFRKMMLTVRHTLLLQVHVALSGVIELTRSKQQQRVLSSVAIYNT